MSCNLFLTSSKEGEKGHLDLIISLPLPLTAGGRGTPPPPFFLEVSLNTRVQLLCSFFFFFKLHLVPVKELLISSDFFQLKVFITLCRSHFLTM